jgi:hypothetical protein
MLGFGETIVTGIPAPTVEHRTVAFKAVMIILEAHAAPAEASITNT